MTPDKNKNSNTPTIAYNDLLSWFEAGYKTKRDWRIGTEHEKFGFCRSNLSPISHDSPKGIQNILQSMADTYAWQPIKEKGKLIALKKGAAGVTLEPGGQLELSGAPLATIHETQNEINEHLDQLAGICKQLGITFLGIGTQPKWGFDEIPWMPKGRYKIMRQYLPQKGRHSLDMMTRTATVQANLDYSDEADMVKKFRLLLALQPVATALFANSPFFDGKLNGFQSFRAEIWRFTDPDRCGFLPFVFEDDFGFERYIDYALDVPMLFRYQNGDYVDGGGVPFREFLAGNLPEQPGYYPTIEDWEIHLSTLFPDVRLKQYLETRGADAGNSQSICALPALWKGLLYNNESSQAAWDLVADWSIEDRMRIVAEVPRFGLKTKTPDGKTLQQLALNILKWSQAGLAALDCRNGEGCNETIYLKSLFQIAKSGISPADRLIDAYQNRWNSSVDPVFKEEEFESFFAKCN
ncbi:MAG: glutamate--cysteine ligase [Magnetococcales bacterium]|nr:glutamate--cysteine ligase [Magnetococcales bacterium]